MFNFLMFNVNWEELRRVEVSVRPNRIFEDTDKRIAEQFQEDNRPEFNLLKKLPCIFCREGRGDEDAYVGYINEARLNGYNLSLEIVLNEDVPSFKNSMMYANRSELAISDLYFSRNHWAVKEVDLYRFLLRKVRPGRQRPTVFTIPEHERIDPSLISVMMPFDSEFNAIYETICQAADSINLDYQCARDITRSQEIMQDVANLIDRSRIVICDCTGQNPNVFYEAGIAHTLGREVILITQDINEIPFDVGRLRCIPYVNNAEGLVELTKTLKKWMQDILKE